MVMWIWTRLIEGAPEDEKNDKTHLEESLKGLVAGSWLLLPTPRLFGTLWLDSLIRV